MPLAQVQTTFGRFGLNKDKQRTMGDFGTRRTPGMQWLERETGCRGRAKVECLGAWRAPMSSQDDEIYIPPDSRVGNHCSRDISETAAEWSVTFLSVSGATWRSRTDRGDRADHESAGGVSTRVEFSA